MVDPLLTPALIGGAVNECSLLLKVVLDNAKSAYRYKKQCEEVVERVEKIQAIVTKLEHSASNTNGFECIDWLKRLQGILEHAKALTNDCSQESRRDKTKRMLKFWRWKKLPTLLMKINIQIDKAIIDASLFILDVVLATNVAVLSRNAGNLLGFAKQATPLLIVGVEESFNKLKTSILLNYGRVDKASTLGLQGSGGAGKTLLAQMLNNDPDIIKLYGEDSVIWISVGLDASFGDLYDRLGKSSILDSSFLRRLKSSHNKEDQHLLLKEAFSKKKVLMILDDVWEKQCDHHDMMYWLDVAKAPGSTTLITTRSGLVLQRAHAEVNVVLSRLIDDDSWKLFCFHAFAHGPISLTTIQEEVARAICKECKGLPLALKVIGSAMMEKRCVDEWEIALLDLQQSTPIFDSKVDDELFGRLQLSYKELKDDATRICFLYFAAYPDEHKIEVEELLKMWVGEELFGSNLNNRVAKMKAYEHLRVLEKRSLINWNEGDKYAHIHDILRDLALYIIDNAKVGECAYECLFHSEKTSISFPEWERVVGLKRMSFINCRFSQWPKDLQIACPQMKVCIFRNATMMESRESLDFLNNMDKLRVLDLSWNSFITEKELESIAYFSHLRKFNLSNCGSIHILPESIGNLKSLTKLDLSRCRSLMGLPESIGNLKSLTELDLCRCGSLTQLPKSIGNLKCLMELDLSRCGSLTRLPESIGNLMCLTKMDLLGCDTLTGLPKSIGNLECLMKLDLQRCRSLIALPESIGNLKCLKLFYLFRCRSLMRLPESIGNLKCLTELDLSGCESLMRLPESIGNLECLTKLYLRECISLTGLPESIGNLECLMKLDLRRCVSLMALPTRMCNLKCLTELDLFGSTSLMGLPESIGSLKSLTKLDLSGCESLMRLPDSIGNLKSLSKLKLLRCESLMGLPKSIGNLECLIKVDLQKCRSLMGLPESIGNLKCLTMLNLFQCGSLTGLPESIGNLKCLTELYLQECGSLTELPESIGNLKCLTELDLSRCGSLTRLPESIGNLKCLTKLYLHKCGSLTGLPESIGNLNFYTKLGLSGCESLMGLPESIGNLERLMMLDMRGCRSLTGLPKSIGNLKSLTKLYLRECRSLTGLPESIGNLEHLKVLDLSSCESLAMLPKSISNLEHLTKLKLGGCESLTGLPKSIHNLKCLNIVH